MGGRRWGGGEKEGGGVRDGAGREERGMGVRKGARKVKTKRDWGGEGGVRRGSGVHTSRKRHETRKIGGEGKVHKARRVSNSVCL